MLEEIRDITSTKKDLKSFGVTIGSILLIIASFLLYKEKGSHVQFFSIGLVFIGSSITVPIILKPVYKFWMFFAVIIGWIMTRLILSVLFFSIITLIGTLTRLLGKDFLNLKSKNQDSYWNIRDREHELNQDYEKQF